MVSIATAGKTVGSLSSPIRGGHHAGHPDGWFDPAEATVRVAGVIDRAGAVTLVPHDVR